MRVCVVVVVVVGVEGGVKKSQATSHSLALMMRKEKEGAPSELLPPINHRFRSSQEFRVEDVDDLVLDLIGSRCE